MGHASRLDQLRRILSGGMRDPHTETHSPHYDQSKVEDRDRNRHSESEKATGESSAPSKDARTDPARGTGELGQESRDPGQPLGEA
jgi:hypothetical protein